MAAPAPARVRMRNPHTRVAASILCGYQIVVADYRLLRTYSLCYATFERATSKHLTPTATTLAEIWRIGALCERASFATCLARH
ncbi:hypothetical protein V5799_030881 [Amblyomma americanum]|uniref:Uncharacterized protein n=1 Tax=Amblyomma americanum TaxID=6943 RepID=A0AAQ4ELW6_AMBAM